MLHFRVKRLHSFIPGEFLHNLYVMYAFFMVYSVIIIIIIIIIIKISRDYN